MSVTKLEKAVSGSYGETKKPKQFMITDSASQAIDEMSEELGVSRSEILEWAIRGGGLNTAKQYRKFQSVAVETLKS